MEFEVGNTYSVTCAQIMFNEDDRVYAIPVFDHLHADPQFDFPHHHYHIDGRFEVAPRLRHYFKVEDGHTSSVIRSEGSTNYRFLAIQIRQFRCERSYTGLILPEFQTAGMIRYKQWYNGFIGKVCQGRKCPHFGTDMLEKGGLLVCPMHQLTADLKNLRIIERKILH